MKLSSRFLLPALAALLTNPAAAGSNTITVSWMPVESSGVPTLGTYGAIALTILLAIVAFRVIKAHPATAKYMAVAALSLTVLATAVLIPQVIASAPVTIPVDGGCEADSATYPDNDSSVTFYNQCDVAMQIQLSFADARCSEGEATCQVGRSCLYSGDVLEPTGDDSPYNLPYCELAE